MGHKRHHAIVVSGFCEEAVEAAHAEATRIFPVVSPLLPSVVNSYTTFLIPPDGSSEGWEPSKDGDQRRAQFKEWLRGVGGRTLDWVEVQYGDDDHETLVTDSDAAARS